MKTKNLIKLSEASRRLGIKYHALFTAVASGRIPATQNDSCTRWYVNEDDLPKIKKILST
jgi:predicted site-specific integrase-resolvase